MTVLPPFTPRLNDRLSAEFLAQSLALLPFQKHQSDAMLDAHALRFEHPEPPRDPDLPLLPSKNYPRPDPAHAEAALKYMTTPPAPEAQVDRKTELDQAVISLLAGHPVLVAGESGSGRTTLLRQIAYDSRIRKRFNRIWWLDDLEEAGKIIGLALNAPNVLRADTADQPRLAREFLEAAGVLLLVDDSSSWPGTEWAFKFTSTIAVGAESASANSLPPDGMRISLGGLPPESSLEWMAHETGHSLAALRPLAERVRYHPRTLRLLIALMVEDNIPPGALNDFLNGVTGDPLLALYTESFGALPEPYQALCRQFAASPRRWIEVGAVIPPKPNMTLNDYRSLSFIERRQFIERRGEALRLIGNWPEIIPGVDGVEGFQPIVRPIVSFAPAASASPGVSQAGELHQQGLAFMADGRDEEAWAALDRALTLRQADDTDHAIAETLVAMARLAYLQGDDAAAIRRLETAAERLHNLRDAESLDVVRLALSRVYRRAGRLDSALSVLGEDSPPEDLAAVYRARREWAEAAAVYHRWINQDGPNREVAIRKARFGLAETYLASGQQGLALTVVKDMELAAGGESFDTLWLRGLIYHLSGDPRTALEWYIHAHNTEVPAEWRAPLARAYGRAMASIGELREAEMLIGAEAIWYEAKLPRPVFARQRISQALAAHLNLMIGDRDRAEVAARSALAVSGERPDPEAESIACRALARLAWKDNKLETALTYFEQEMTAQGAILDRDEHETGVTLHNIAEIQHTLGQRERAVANYRRALTHKNPGRDRQSVILTRLALREILIELGRHDEALESGQAALTLVTQSQDIDLQLLGYVLAIQAQVQREQGLAPGSTAKGARRATQQIPVRASSILDEWVTRLGVRINDGLAHPFWAVNLLAAGLYLRSTPPITDPIPIIDVAEKAVEVAERQVPGTPAAWAARRDLGTLYLRLERWADAYEVYAPLHSEVVSVSEPLIALAAQTGSARAAAALGRVDDAIHHFDAAIPLEPELFRQIMILRESADTYRVAGDDARAADRYMRILEQLDKDQYTSTYIETIVTLAYTRLRMRRFGDAIDTFEEALAVAERRSDTDPALLASVLYDMGTAHLTLGQFKRAASVFRRSLQYQNQSRAPERYVETLIGLARSSVEVDDLHGALEAYHESLQSDTLSQDLRRTLLKEQGGVFARAGQTQTAITTYESALAIEGASVIERAGLHREIGILYTHLNNHEKARQHFETVLQSVQDEDTGLTLQALGDGFRAQGRPEEAVTTYKQALERLDRSVNPVEMASAARAIGEIYLNQGQAGQALPHLEMALEIERALPQQNGGRIVSTLRSIGHAHDLMGELEKATYRHHEALVYQDARHEPDGYIDTLRTLGSLYSRLKRYGEAAKALEEALSTEGKQPIPNRPRTDEMTAALADVYRAQGRLEAAASLYRQVAESSAGPAEEGVQKRATQELKTTDAEIERHLQTLEVAAQSWQLLNRAAKSDLKSQAFVRALQAKTCAILGRGEDSADYYRQLIALLRSRRAEMTSEAIPMRVLRLLVEGQDQEDGGNTQAAAEAYQKAVGIAENDPNGDASLLWVVRHKASAKAARR